MSRSFVEKLSAAAREGRVGMMTEGTLVLRRSEVAGLLTVEECVAAVEGAFRLYGEGAAARPGILSVRGEGGGAFHIKAGVLGVGRSYFVAKCNGNFPGNAERNGLPTIQGVILLCDASDGRVLAVLDSIEITIRRTGAATAVAAKYLARADSKVVTVCGCGNQGRISLQTLARVRAVTRAYAFDSDEARAARFADELSQALGIEVEATGDLEGAVGRSDICVTCTPARRYFLRREWVAPGAFVAGVGADGEGKQELDPRLLASSKVVVDILEQCAEIGDLRHAVAEGLMSTSDVHAELGEVVAGRKEGRTGDDETIVFDSTGMALQDAAAAALVYERAVAAGVGLRVNFAD